MLPTAPAVLPGPTTGLPERKPKHKSAHLKRWAQKKGTASLKGRCLGLPALPRAPTVEAFRSYQWYIDIDI